MDNALHSHTHTQMHVCKKYWNFCLPPFPCPCLYVDLTLKRGLVLGILKGKYQGRNRGSIEMPNSFLLQSEELRARRTDVQMVEHGQAYMTTCAARWISSFLNTELQRGQILGSANREQILTQISNCKTHALSTPLHCHLLCLDKL